MASQLVGAPPARISARAQTAALGAIPAGHPREVFIDGKLMAAPDQDVPQDRGPRFDGPRDGGRGGAPRRDQVRRQKAHKATTARELALAAIHQLRERDAFAQDIIAKTIDISPLSREDRAFATRLVLGVVSTRGTLEDIITGCMDSPDDAAPAVRDALCLSAYEIVFLQKSPHAAVDQGVELVKSVAPRAGGLANAVLRRVVRAKEVFPFGDPRTDIAAYARLHGFPVWLAKRLRARARGRPRLHGSLERAGSGLHRRQRAEGRHRRGGRLGSRSGSRWA